MADNPVGWFEIYVQDMARARKFYESVLKVKLDDLPSPDGSDVQMVAFPMGMDRPGASGALVIWTRGRGPHASEDRNRER